MCGFIAQLVEHRTGIAEVTGSNPVEALIFIFFQASSFQLLKLENSLRGSFFTFIYNRSSYELFHIYINPGTRLKRKRGRQQTSQICIPRSLSVSDNVTRVEGKECNNRESVCDNSKSVRGINNLRKLP